MLAPSCHADLPDRVAELEWDTAVVVEDIRRDYGEPRLLAMARPDEDNPEWTKKDFARTRPAANALPEFIGEKATRS